MKQLGQVIVDFNRLGTQLGKELEVEHTMSSLFSFNFQILSIDNYEMSFYFALADELQRRNFNIVSPYQFVSMYKVNLFNNDTKQILNIIPRLEDRKAVLYEVHKHKFLEKMGHNVEMIPVSYLNGMSEANIKGCVNEIEKYLQ